MLTSAVPYSGGVRMELLSIAAARFPVTIVTLGRLCPSCWIDSIAMTVSVAARPPAEVAVAARKSTIAATLGFVAWYACLWDCGSGRGDED